MESMNGAGAMEIVHATPQAADVNPVANIEPAKDMHSTHVLGSLNSTDDSTSDGNVSRIPLRASARC